jgi:hypothetical protein
MLLTLARGSCRGCAASRARAGRRCWNTHLGGLATRSGHAGRTARPGMRMARQLADGWTAVTIRPCFPHGSLQPYHAPEGKPHHGDRSHAGQHHESSAKPPRRSLHPGPGRRTPRSAGTSPGALGSGRPGWWWYERIAHDRAAAGLAAAPQAPNLATSQQEGGHPSQPHGPTAACGDAVRAPRSDPGRTPLASERAAASRRSCLPSLCWILPLQALAKRRLGDLPDSVLGQLFLDVNGTWHLVPRQG